MSTADDRLHAIALSMVPRVGDVHARILMDHYGSATPAFHASRRELEAIPGIGEIRAQGIRKFKAFHRAEEEVSWTERMSVDILVYGSPGYPRRLRHCPDGPIVLYNRGAITDPERAVAIIGTRKPTTAGLQAVSGFVEGLASQGIQVISGLAQGIDTEAHRAALKHGLSTVGVLGHGLDILYPPSNARLARMMMEQGALVTEFRNGTLPDAPNFPKRNRIVAGLSDAVLVIETGIKGGSMITAGLAFGYDRDLFAIPGRITDQRSLGCNQLIRGNKAMLVTGPEDIVSAMNWDLPDRKPRHRQAALFADLDAVEGKVMEVVQMAGTLDADNIGLRAGMRSSQVSGVLLSLEMKGLIRTLPGKRYAPA
jgi:DNA processing protein